jgi:5-methylcytosine-specific restriction endonuclease McrA
MSSHECDRVNSTSAGVMERQTCVPQKDVGASPCGFKSHLRHHSNRPHGPRRTWSDEQLVDAVPACISLRAVLRRLGLHPTGANYKTLQATIARLGLDTHHFLGQAHLRGKSHGWAHRLPLDVILVANSTYMSMWNLKRRLLSGGLLESKCSECGLTEWRGSRLVLVLDHVNGDARDHRLENLRLLCPNCNSQTATFAGRNKRRRRLEALDRQSRHDLQDPGRTLATEVCGERGPSG